MAKRIIYCKVIRKKVNPETWPDCINNFDCNSCSPPPKIRKQPQRKALEKWVNGYWLLLPFRDEEMKPEWKKVNGEWKRLGPPRKREKFYNGSFNEIRRKLCIKYADERYAEQLLDCSFEFGQQIDFEVRTVPSKKQILYETEKHASMKGISPLKEEERKKELIGLVSRVKDLPAERLNRPLYYYVSALAIYWEKWTGREVRRANENNERDINLKFYDFIDYCIESMGLWQVWGTGSVKKAIQRVVHDFLLPARDYLKTNYPSTSLSDIDPLEVMGSIYLSDSISDSVSKLIIDSNLLKS